MGTEMLVVAKALKIDIPGETGVILRRLHLELKRKGQIIRYVGIWQIVQGTFGCRITQSIVKKDLGCGFSIDFCYKMAVFGDAVPV